MSVFNLEKQLIFYASYHDNAINKAIHLVCIWPILWSGLALLAYLGVMPMPAAICDVLPLQPEAWNLHAGTLLSLAYMVVYCAMDPFAGMLAAALVLACHVTANLCVAGGLSAAVVLAVHVFGWAAQVFGHAVFEGRAPALVDSPFQAFVAAPFFVLLEVLLHLGYRTEMQERVTKQARINIAEYRAAEATLEKSKAQ